MQMGGLLSSLVELAKGSCCVCVPSHLKWTGVHVAASRKHILMAACVVCSLILCLG
jgi:hypothetical protein